MRVACSATLAAVVGCAPRRGASGPDFVGTLRVSGSNAFVNSQPTRPGARIYSGDALSTGLKTSVVVDLVDDSTLQLDEQTGSRVTVHGDPCVVRVGVSAGQIYASKETNNKCGLVIHALNTELAARTQFNLNVRPQLATLTVIKGTIEVQSGKAVTVGQRQQMDFSGTTATDVKDITKAQVKQATGWRLQYKFGLCIWVGKVFCFSSGS